MLFSLDNILVIVWRKFDRAEYENKDKNILSRMHNLIILNPILKS